MPTNDFGFLSVSPAQEIAAQIVIALSGSDSLNKLSDIEELLERKLLELKSINIHLSEGSEAEILEGDIEE